MNRKTVNIGSKTIGDGFPIYIIAEIGINHNGDLDLAKKLIDAANLAGCDAVKFQKRAPEKCVPPEQQNVMRETPWGEMTYLEYKHRLEFGEDEYAQIDGYCRDKGIDWFASVWDEDSVDFLEKFDVSCYKVPSAALTDFDLLRKVRNTRKPVILSTGMSNLEQINSAVDALGGTDNLVIMHCVSTYPAKPEELNLKAIETLINEFDCPIGYSGHEVGLQTTYAAVALGADIVERHITLDRAMWGTDQAASVEPFGLMRMVRDIRVTENALGDGVKRIHENEVSVMKKLRRKDDTKILDLYLNKE